MVMAAELVPRQLAKIRAGTAERTEENQQGAAV